LKGGAYYIQGSVTSGQFVQSVVTTSGTSMTWVSGNTFNTSWSSVAANLNGTAFTITSCATTTTCTLSTSAGALTRVLLGEKITQATSAATAEVMGAPYNSTDLVNLWANASGTPDATHHWTGSLSSAVYTPTLVPTALTVAATGETALQVRTAATHGAGSAVVNTTLFPNFPTQPLDTTAFVIMPSYHYLGVSLTQLQADLYCGIPSGATSQAVCSGSGATRTCKNSNQQVSCADSGQTLTTEAINDHIKPGGTGSPPIAWEGTLKTAVTNVEGTLSTTDVTKPLYDTENAYSTCGWPSATCDTTGGTPNVWGINQMNAAFLGGAYVYANYLGISEDVLYNWNNSHGGLGPLGAPCTVNAPLGCANVAYNTVFGWLVGTTGLSCSITNGAGTNSLYTCTLTSAGSVAEQIMWDNAELCTGAWNSGSKTWTSVSCPTTNETVPVGFTTYYDIYGDAGTSISAHTVPVGIAPVFMH
jgi:hypothetical protein